MRQAKEAAFVAPRSTSRDTLTLRSRSITSYVSSKCRLRPPRNGPEISAVKLERLSRLGLMLAVLLIATASTTDARNHRHHHHHHSSAYNRHGCNATATWDCRSLAVKHEFWDMTGHPHGWKGHIVDHR